MNEPDRQADEAKSADEQDSLPSPRRMLLSEDLLQGEHEVLIVHGEEIYRLKVTGNNKLILQK